MTFRILSLDGGGIRGLLSLQILQRLEQEVPGWIDRADLIAGTSAGGIIALALAHGGSPSQLIEMYDRLAPHIFSNTGRNGFSGLRKYFRAKNNNNELRVAVSKFFEGTTLEQLKKRVLIVTFKLGGGRQETSEQGWKPKIFHNLQFEKDSDSLRVSKLALYTSATPCIFPSVDGFVDGGIIANNPSLVALAMIQDRNLQMDNRPNPEQIVLFSVGTGNSRRGIEGTGHDWGYLQWSRFLFDMMVEGGVMLTEHLCQQFLDERYHRISPVIPTHVRADDWKRKRDLARYGSNLEIERTISWLKRYWNM